MEKQMTAAAFTAKAENVLAEKWGYIWGKSGQVWTKAEQDAATRSQTIQWGKQWIGKRVCDCSGLIVWALKTAGIDIYHGSNTMWQRECAAKGILKDGQRADGERLKRGTAVFLRDQLGSRHHVGIYAGGGRVIEAKGTRDGVVVSGIERWQEWGELKAVDYSEEGVCANVRTMEYGCAGEDVKALQERLKALGYDCGAADGRYGARTAQAVKALQADAGITADGMAGRETIQRLTEAEEKQAAAAGGNDRANARKAWIREAAALLKMVLEGWTDE